MKITDKLFGAKKLTFCALLMFLFYGQSKSTDRNSIENSDGHVVLIFNDAPLNRFHRFPSMVSGIMTHEITYVDDNLIDVREIVSDSKRDTVVIRTSRSYINVQHVVQGFDEYNYFFAKGDTVIFSYQGLKPIAMKKGSREDYLSMNYEIIRRKLICNDTFPALIVMKNFPTFSSVIPQPSFEKGEAFFKAMRNKNRLEVRNEKRLLDSLNDHGLIRKEYYELYLARWRQDSVLSLLINPNFWYVRRDLDSVAADQAQRIILANYQDTLLYHSFYQGTLDLLYQLNGRQVPRKTAASGDSPNFEVLYNFVNGKREYPGNLKEVLLLRIFQDLLRTTSSLQVKEYTDRFSADIKANPLFVSFIINKYKLGEKITAKLNLITPHGLRTDFDEILAENSGKLVYVDFWTSWCGPCIQAFPASGRLKEKFADQDVAFIYISKDEVAERWKSASAKYQIDPQNSFLIENIFTSEFLNKMRIETIPHYLLFDKSGKLIDRNAPGPGTKDIENLIEKHL